MKKIFDLVKQEEKRQRDNLVMIPSENYTYPQVRKVVGSVLMHKYAEGQPYKRYYQGMENVDRIEDICKITALKVFKLDNSKWGVNVQAYSGSPANLAVYNALLEPGDRIMSMYLPDGGHLSHGWHTAEKKISFVSKVWKVKFYHVDPKTQMLDYEKIRQTAEKFSPKLIISGGTAYPQEIDHKKLAAIAQDVGAYYLADVAHEAGLIAAQVNKSPFRYADVVTMTTHKTLRGPRGALIFARKDLCEAMDASVFPGLQGGPHMNTIAGIAVTLDKAGSKPFRKYAQQTVLNAKRIALNLKKRGYLIVSGGTAKHLVLVDLRNKNINGWFAAWALEAAGIVVNRNTIPYDSSPAYYPSGLRIGTPAITARGMKEAQIDKISDWMDEVITHIGERQVPEEKQMLGKYLSEFKKEIAKDKVLKKIKKQVVLLTKKFPLES